LSGERRVADSRITVARASAADAGVVARLVHALLDELSGGKALAPADLQSSATHLLEQGQVEGLIATLDGKPIGVLMLNPCAAIYAGGRFGEITELYVTPAHRSDGVAALLLAEAKDVAKEHE